MRRGFWFAAGAASGVYVLARARRTAESLTPEGLRDRLAGLSHGAQLFTEEVRAGMNEREEELRAELALASAAQLRAIEASRTDLKAESVGSS